MKAEEAVKSIAEGARAKEIVEKVLALTRDEQEELVQVLGGMKSDNAALFLSGIYPSVSDKKLQKLIKRALFRLKTQGIRVEEPRMPGEPALRRVETVREARGFLSNYDEAMTRVALAALEGKKNQFILGSAVLHFSNGLAELKMFPASRDELEEFVKDFSLRMSSGMVLLPISAAYAGCLIEEASGLSGNEASEARDLSRMLSAAPGNVRKPGDIYHLAAPDTASEASADAVFSDEIFEPFALRWPGIEEDRKKLHEAVKSAIILPPYAIEERRQAFLNELAGSERTAASLPLLKRMLEDYAYLFYCSKKFDHYKGLLAVIASPEGLKGAFLRFAQKTFEEMEETDARQPGVVVDPYSLLKR